jgi:hypothetical protein
VPIEIVEANPGSGGVKFAVDNITQGPDTLSVPYVKLMSGADAVGDVIPGTASNGLLVDVSRVQGNVSVTQGGAWSVNQAGVWNVNASQSGTWTVNSAQSGTWTVNAAQSGVWNVSASQSGTWNVNSAQSGTWTVNSVQSGIWNVNAAQSGAWSVNQAGTWNVNAVQSGAWTVNSVQSGAWNVSASQSGVWSVNAAQSGAWAVDVNNAVKIQDGQVGSGVTKTAFVNATAAGNTTIVAGVTGKKIRVLGYRIQAQGTVNVKFVDSSPQDLTFTWKLQDREGAVSSAPLGAFEFETAVGASLQINLSAAVQVGAQVIYVEV